MTSKSALCICLISFVFSFQSKAQSSFPTFPYSPSWNVEWCYFGSFCSTDTFMYEKDTAFCGHTYSKINLSNSVTGFTRNSGQKTYVRKSTECADREYLMYDYSLSIGDVVYTGNHLYNTYPIDTVPFKLTKIDLINSMGNHYRRFEMTPVTNDFGGPVGAPMHWIEGIGSDINPFYSFYCLETGFCETFHKTLCYSEYGVQQYQDLSTDSCFVQTTGIQELKSKGLSIFPNPFREFLHISFHNQAQFKYVKIFDAIGNLAESIDAANSHELQLGNTLPAGIYGLEIMTQFGVVSHTVIKTNE